ncbi:MAG: hypothetical protein GF370_03425 [Candidatus Nealsonbacteria bacterium]|nr:hypothetical protein [Candidatus Nealsonbacteria bacterium]
MYLIDITLFAITVLTLILIAQVLLRGKRDAESWSFGFMVFASGFLWTLSILMFRMSSAPTWVWFWAYIIYIAGILSPISALLFSQVFLNKEKGEEKLPQKIKLACIIPFFIFSFLLFLGDLWIQDITIGQGLPGTKKVHLGPAYTLWVVFLVLYLLWAVVKLWKRYRKLSKEETIQKRQFEYVFIGMLFPVLGCLPFNVIGPLFGEYSLIWVGPLSMAFFSVWSFLAILRFHLFEIKVILTETLVVLMGAFIFLLPFWMPNQGLVFLTMGIFVFFCVFGYLLIRATHAEIERREKIEKMTDSLQEAYSEIKILSQTKTEFLKVVNHQLRTPVSIVKGMLSMLEEGSVKGEKKQEFIEKSYLASERLTTILDDILTAQRLTGGPPDINLTPCKIKELIKDIVKHYQPFTKRKDLKLKFIEPKEDLPLVLLDKEIVKRTISRLVDNAINYTKEGEVTVSLGTATKKDKEFIEIQVRDSGIGITEKERKALFELFYRGEKATYTNPNGSGLGLFIVKSLVEAHQGFVEVESEGRGRGTTFAAYFPLRSKI